MFFYCCFVKKTGVLWLFSDGFKDKKIWKGEKDDMKDVCEKPVIKGISEGATVKKGQTLRLKCLLDGKFH